MVKRRIGIIGLLLCICLCLMPCSAEAVSTADAKELISPERSCTLTVSYLYEGTAFSDLPVSLYKIADVNEECYYTLTAPFRSSELILNGIQTNGEWDVVRFTVEAHMISNGIAADAAAVTDQTGRACFDSLAPGLYLVVPGTGTAGEVQCVFDSTLVSLPGLSTEGLWEYEEAIASKGTPVPPGDSGEENTYHVLKLWRGDSADSGRPNMIEVDIFRNRVFYQTVILSEDNHWSYSWTAKDDGTDWMVAERNVPSGYTVTLEQQDTTFVLTNTKIPDHPSPEELPPKTGDTSNILLYILLMSVSGSLLVLMGLTGKNKRV